MSETAPDTLAHEIAERIQDVYDRQPIGGFDLDDAWEEILRHKRSFALGGETDLDPYIHENQEVYTDDMTVMFADGSLLNCDTDDEGKELLVRPYENVAQAILAQAPGVRLGETHKVERVNVMLSLDLTSLVGEKPTNPKDWNWQDILVRAGFDVDVMDVSAELPGTEDRLGL